MKLPGVTQEELTEVAVIASKDFDKMFWVIGILVGVGLVAVLLHRRGRQQASKQADDSSMTRPVLAILLVGGLVILSFMSFAVADEQTRNLLVGAMISLASAAAAFYFASTTATEARKDLMGATMGVATVPILKGKSLATAKDVMSMTQLKLTMRDEPTNSDVDLIQIQEPAAGTSVKPGSPVAISFRDALKTP